MGLEHHLYLNFELHIHYDSVEFFGTFLGELCIDVTIERKLVLICIGPYIYLYSFFSALSFTSIFLQPSSLWSKILFYSKAFYLYFKMFSR